MTNEWSSELAASRVCILQKWENFNGYGFNLHADKGKVGQYVGSVDRFSPAECGGLRKGDRIIEVNEKPILKESHQRVVELIKENNDHVTLFVMTEDSWNHFKQQGVEVSSSLKSVVTMETPSINPYSNSDKISLRNCILHKWPDFHGYGFNLQSIESKKGQFVGVVDPESPSHVSGLREGDRVVSVNNIKTNQKTHKEVVDLIKSDPNQVTLLVIDPYNDKYLASKKGVAIGDEGDDELWREIFILDSESPKENPSKMTRHLNHENGFKKSSSSSSSSSSFHQSDQKQHITDNINIENTDNNNNDNTDNLNNIRRNNNKNNDDIILAGSAKEARMRMRKKKNVKDEEISLTDKYKLLQKL